MSVEAIPGWDHPQENEMETKVRIAYHEIEMVIHSRKVCAKANEIAYMCRMRGGISVLTRPETGRCKKLKRSSKYTVHDAADFLKLNDLHR